MAEYPEIPKFVLLTTDRRGAHAGLAEHIHRLEHDSPDRIVVVDYLWQYIRNVVAATAVLANFIEIFYEVVLDYAADNFIAISTLETLNNVVADK